MFAKFQELREEREDGFTLIELLVVILIIGILSAIAIPAFLNQRKSAVDATLQSDVSNAAKQVETWAVKKAVAQVPNGTVAKTGDSTVNSYSTVAETSSTPLADIKVSDGAKLAIQGTGVGTYRITGENDGGSETYLYDSANGGMQRTVATAVEVPAATNPASKTVDGNILDKDTYESIGKKFHLTYTYDEAADKLDFTITFDSGMSGSGYFYMQDNDGGYPVYFTAKNGTYTGSTSIGKPLNGSLSYATAMGEFSSGPGYLI